MAMRMMMMMMVVVVWGGDAAAAAPPSLMDQCSSKLPAVMSCVGFASGKEATPAKTCCDSVTAIKDTNPACLCFVIQLIHNGTTEVFKEMNIKEEKLLQLPTACNIANASMSDCPKLLHLPANSTDAAIFTANSTTASPTVGTTSSSTAKQINSNSSVFVHRVPKLMVSILVTVSMILLLADLFFRI